MSVTNTFAGRAPVALAPVDSVLVCCNRTTAMDIQVLGVPLIGRCLVGSVDFFVVIFCAGNEERRRGAEDEAMSDFEWPT